MNNILMNNNPMNNIFITSIMNNIPSTHRLRTALATLAIGATLSIGLNACQDELSNPDAAQGINTPGSLTLCFEPNADTKPAFAEAKEQTRNADTDTLPDADAQPDTRSTTVPGAPTRATQWAVGDRLLAAITLADASDATTTYTLYTTLKCTTANPSPAWEMAPTDGGTIYVATTVAGLATCTTNDRFPLLAKKSDGTVCLILPSELAKKARAISLSAVMTYAPGMEWTAESSGTGITAVSTGLKADASRGSTERWQTAYSIGTFNTRTDAEGTPPSISLLPPNGRMPAFEAYGNSARLRVYTGRSNHAGDVVTLICPAFVPADGTGKSAGNTYTSLTDAQGNAYFYGTTGPDPLDGTTGKSFGLSLQIDCKVSNVDGTTVNIPVTKQLFNASTHAPVKLAAGGTANGSTYADASHNIAINATLFAEQAEATYTESAIIIDASKYSTTDAMKNAIVNAYNKDKGKNNWVVFNLAGNTSTDAARLAGLKAALQAAGKDGEETRTGIITLLMPQLTTLSVADAFQDCTTLVNIDLPALKTITADNAFRGCSAITNANLPLLETLKGASTFYDCKLLAAINLPQLTEITVDNTFRGCSKLDYLNLPLLQKVEANYTFQKCPMNSMEMPLLKTINGNNNFESCKPGVLYLPSLTGITGNENFKSLNGSIGMPQLAEISGDRNFYQSSIISLDLPQLTELSGDENFQECDKMISLNLPGITEITGNYTFSGCSGLTSINLPSITSISGGSTFSGCHGLTQINETTFKLPLVTKLPDYAFSQCSNLTSVDLPKITKIGNYTFSGCTSLTQINETTFKLPLVTELPDYTFNNCSNLTSVDLPNITKIGDDTFIGCKALTNVSLPDVTMMGDETFVGCSNLNSVHLPKVSEIGSATFSYCGNLKVIDLPSLTQLGSSTFYSSGLTTLSLGPITMWNNPTPIPADPTKYSGVTLTLHPDQKEMQGSSSGTYTATGNAFTGWGTGKSFCGFTFREIKKGTE